MSRFEQQLLDGHLAAKGQRERLKLRVAATRDRLAPNRLVNDLRTEAEQQVRATATNIVSDVKTHPVRTALLGTAVLAWVFRHPLIAHGPDWLKRGYAVVSGRYAQVGEVADEIDTNIDESTETCGNDAEPCASDTVQENDSH